MSDNPTMELAAFAADFTLRDAPSRVRGFVVDLLLDTVASGIAGRHGDETAQIEALARTIGGEGDSTVVGGPSLSPVGAVLLNGYQITAVTVCDIHRPLLCHVTPGVIPAAIAIAEQRGATGAELLSALIVGLETEVRVGLGLSYPSFRARGWHSPGVIGPFGGAAAVGHLIGLDAEGMVNAFGLAGSQAAGTFAAWGTPTVKWHQSRGGASGLLAGLLAAEGFRSSPNILTHPDGGMVTTYSDGGDPAAFTDRLGERWELEQISLRRWPVASSIQSVVTALFALIDQVAPDPATIRKVRVGLSDTVYRMHGELGWDTRFRAHLSTRYVTSIVLHDRRCWLEEFLPNRFQDPVIDAFARDVVVVEPDDSVKGTGAVVELSMTDGSVHRDVREVPKGDVADPLTRVEIEEKFHDARAGIVADEDAGAFLDELAGLAEPGDVRSLVTPLRGDADRAPAVSGQA